MRCWVWDDELAAERKQKHYGRADVEYSMSVIDLAAAYAKIGDEDRSMEVSTVVLIEQAGYDYSFLLCFLLHFSTILKP